jgi:SAM-dependent methyltransferase
VRRGFARLFFGLELRRLDEAIQALDAVQAGLRGAQGAIDVLGREARSESDARVELQRHVQSESSARVELQRHVEARLEGVRAHSDTRQDQLAVEIADLRSALVEAHRDLATAEQRLASQDEDTSVSLRAVQAEAERLRDVRFPELQARMVEVQTDLAGLRDERVRRVEGALGALQAGLSAALCEVETVRDERLPQLERSVERLHADNQSVLALAEELRDARLPALSGRVDALVSALHEELAASSGLLDRVIAGEPLHVETDATDEAELPEALRRAWATFADTFRGDRAEVRDRAAEYIPVLQDSQPVLDLGCGRGELLEVLRDHGIESRGVDSDAAMVQGCRRLGLAVEQADALAELRAVPAHSLGAVTAVHLAEHLGSAGWMVLVDLAARALRPGGLLLIECPNPESLRVGATLFWIDPTHRVPVHPDAMGFVARAVGLDVVEIRRLRPFPPEQMLANPQQPEQVRALSERLDAWLSGPRDFLLIARRPTE